MGFLRRKATTTKLEIPEGAVKEATLLFHYDIVSKVERFDIVININQTPIKYVPVGQSSLAKKSGQLRQSRVADKRTIENFLKMQLTHAGFTAMSMKPVILLSRS